MLKMAGHVGKLFQALALNQCNKNIKKLSPLRFMVPYISSERTLYSKSSLGLDAFEQQKERTKFQLSNLEDSFKDRMKSYVSDDKNMIFTEDLKNMVHLANNAEDVELVVSMIRRFNKQNKQLRFGTFKFGPIVMRLFHSLNKPELAIECFKSEEFTGFFDQLISYQIYLDLLYENKMYKEVLESFDVIQNRQIEGALFPRNSIVIVLAACFKMNNAESMKYAFKLWKKMQDAGYYPTRRAVTFCAALALNQGNPQAALEIVAQARNQGYTTVRNIKALTLAKLGRLEDVLPVLKTILEQDSGNQDVHTFNCDVMAQVKECFVQADNAELNVEFKRIEQLFQNQGHISDKTLEEQLCSEINSVPKSPVQQQRQGNFNRSRQNFDNRGYRQNYDNRSQRQGFRSNVRSRPGLEDLV